MGLSWWHILLVLVVFVLLFGTGKISSLMGDVAKGLKSFKKEMAENGEENPENKLLENTSRRRQSVSRTQAARERKAV